MIIHYIVTDFWNSKKRFNSGKTVFAECMQHNIMLMFRNEEIKKKVNRKVVAFNKETMDLMIEVNDKIKNQ